MSSAENGQSNGNGNGAVAASSFSARGAEEAEVEELSLIHI